jgi:hypothetical protein
MTIRSLLRALRPWRQVGICTKCGWSGEPRWHPRLPKRDGNAGCSRCDYLCVAVYRVRAPWVCQAIALACLLVGLMIGAANDLAAWLAKQEKRP